MIREGNESVNGKLNPGGRWIPRSKGTDVGTFTVWVATENINNIMTGRDCSFKVLISDWHNLAERYKYGVGFA